MDMSKWALLGGGAALGVVAGMWDKVKGIFHNISSIAVVNIKIEGQVAYAVSMYIVRNFKRGRLGDISVTGSNEYVRSEMQNQLVAFKVFPNKSTRWRRGWRIIWIRSMWRGVVVSFIRGTFDVDQFIFDAVKYFNATKRENGGSDRFFVTRKQGSVGEKMSAALKALGPQGKDGPKEEGFDSWGDIKADKYSAQPVGWQFDDIGQPYHENAVDVLSLNKEALDAYTDIREWRRKEEWYKQHLIPWKLGQHYVGLAGTGKTALVRAIGQAENMPIFIFDLASMTNTDFVTAWGEAMDWSPCIVLIEDIHKVYEGGKRVADTGEEAGLTFDCLLNVLDGVENTDGIVTIITSNDITKVDPTLGGTHGLKDGVEPRTRPGRVDRVVHFGVLDLPGREKMATRILDEVSNEKKKEIVKGGEDMTGAEFQDLCRRVAQGLNGEGHD